MKLILDTDAGTLTEETQAASKNYPLYSDEAFAILSQYWVKMGWNQKYTYTFSWLGRPIIQLPEDMVRIQELIYQVQPDVIIETGIAHGGSLIYYASLCEMLKKGRVIGIDIEIRSHNRKAIETHPLFDRIDLIESSSTEPAVIECLQEMIQPGEKVLVILDSCHTAAHVAQELKMYAPLVTVGSYLVVTDGLMKDLSTVPLGHPDWTEDNPCAATYRFLEAQDAFELRTPQWLFNESQLNEDLLSNTLTHWPDAYLYRKS